MPNIFYIIGLLAENPNILIPKATIVGYTETTISWEIKIIWNEPDTFPSPETSMIGGFNASEWTNWLKHGQFPLDFSTMTRQELESSLELDKV